MILIFILIAFSDGLKEFKNNIKLFLRKCEKTFLCCTLALICGIVILVFTNSNYNFLNIVPTARQVEQIKKNADRQYKIDQDKTKQIRIEQKQLYKKLYQTKDANEKAKLHVEIDKNNQEINDLNN